MAKTSIEVIYDHIDKYTKAQQVNHDLPFLLKHYSTLKELGIKDDMIVELFNKGLLEMSLKEELDGLRK